MLSLAWEAGKVVAFPDVLVAREESKSGMQLRNAARALTDAGGRWSWSGRLAGVTLELETAGREKCS